MKAMAEPMIVADKTHGAAARVQGTKARLVRITPSSQGGLPRFAIDRSFCAAPVPWPAGVMGDSRSRLRPSDRPLASLSLRSFRRVLEPLGPLDQRREEVAQSVAGLCIHEVAVLVEPLATHPLRSHLVR